MTRLVTYSSMGRRNPSCRCIFSAVTPEYVMWLMSRERDLLHLRVRIIDLAVTL